MIRTLYTPNTMLILNNEIVHNRSIAIENAEPVGTPA